MSAALKDVGDGFAFWREAGAAFMAGADLPKRGTREGEAVAWSFPDTVAVHALPNLARVLAAMGLTRRLMSWPRGGCPLGYEARLRSSELAATVAATPCFLMARDDRTDWVWVCSASGDWITWSGGAKGEGITGLGAFMWNVGPGEAARRIVRACGYRSLPRVGDLR